MRPLEITWRTAITSIYITSIYNYQHGPQLPHYQDYFVIGGIRICLGISDDPMFLRISSNSFTEFAACSKRPRRDNHRKASYPRTQQQDQGAVEPRLNLFDQGCRKNNAVYPFGHAADNSKQFFLTTQHLTKIFTSIVSFHLSQSNISKYM